MIIVQTVWQNRACWVWGETASKPDDRLSPFDVGADGLRRFLRQLLWDESTSLVSAPLTLLLPSVKEGNAFRPLSSLAFLNGRSGEEDAPCTLQPWPVTAARIEGKPLLLLLNRARQRRIEEGVFAGSSLLAFSDFLTFTGTLVAHGHYLPDLKQEQDGTWNAVWSPCLDGSDTCCLRTLAERIPLAAIGAGGDRMDIANSLLNALVDSLVRAAVVTTLSQAQADHGRFYSPHDAWFAALRGVSPAVRWPNSAELIQLREQLALWRYPVTCQQQSDTTLRFILSAPASEEAPWPLRIQISSPDGVKDFPANVSASVPNGLLLFLGQAAMLFPPLATAGEITTESGTSYGCSLTRDEAYLFLISSAGILSGAGYSVELPQGWKTGRPNAVELIANVKTEKKEKPARENAGAAPAQHGLDENVELRWAVTLNGESVSAGELAQLLHAQSPLVFFRGKWIQVDVRKLQEAFRVWNRTQAEVVTARDVVGIALGHRGKADLNVAFVRADGWLQPFLSQLAGDQPFRVLPQPPNLHGTLRPYQTRGYSWLCFLRQWGFGSCLADDMGLGKTVQTLAFLLHEKTMGEKRPALIVGPMSVLGNWVRETQRFAPSLRVLLHHGSDRWHGESFPAEARNADVVFTSYTLLYRDYMDLRKVNWAGIILDEAQNIKNPDTHQSEAARALSADYRIALTGTPMENNVGDVWSIMDFLNPGLLGKRAVFRERYFRPIQTGTDPGARLQLRHMTAPFILRRLKTDKQIISDLPDKVENKVYCPLTLEQAQLYRQALDFFQHEIQAAEGMSRRGLILAVLTHLKQICNHPANYLGQHAAETNRSGKLTRLNEMLEEVFEAGECALVFTQYAEMGALLQQNLCQNFAEDMPFLYGSVPRKERDRMVESFQESSRPLAFILSLKAGGTGLNLTRATHVFHFDRWWNPAVENQATDRAFRIGQTHNVMVHKFICGGTLEDRIDKLIAGKTALTDAIIANGEKGLTELSNSALHDLLKLDADADLILDRE